MRFRDIQSEEQIATAKCTLQEVIESLTRYEDGVPAHVQDSVDWLIALLDARTRLRQLKEEGMVYENAPRPRWLRVAWIISLVLLFGGATAWVMCHRSMYFDTSGPAPFNPFRLHVTNLPDTNIGKYWDTNAVYYRGFGTNTTQIATTAWVDTNMPMAGDTILADIIPDDHLAEWGIDKRTGKKISIVYNFRYLRPAGYLCMPFVMMTKPFEGHDTTRHPK